jgi:hypothetical protein
MTANHDLERRLTESYSEEGLLRAADRVLAAALATIETIPQQRRVLSRVPWRFPSMSNTKLAVAALAGIAVVALALAASLGARAPSVGTDPSPGSTTSPSAVAAASPSSTVRPALTETFTSAVHGISIGYPAGWSVRPATEAWTTGIPFQGDPFGDLIYDSANENRFLLLASKPLAGQRGESWAYEVSGHAEWRDSCEPMRFGHGIKGYPAIIAVHCPDPVLNALAWIEDRGYLIVFYGSEDMDWFREILATVQLIPGDAIADVDGVAVEFRHPFAYVWPAGVGWDLGPIQADAYYEFRIPDSSPVGSAVGVILRAIDGGRVDPCAASSDTLPLPGGPGAVIEYLRGLSGVEIVDQTTTTIGLLPAVQGMVEMAEATADCPELRPFARHEGVEETEVISEPDVHVRMTVVDVGGDHVVIWTYLTVDDTSWYAVADELIDSFRFRSVSSPLQSPAGG